MNNLIKAADELAGIVRREMAHYDDPEGMMAALNAYRTARNEKWEVKVKPLVWVDYDATARTVSIAKTPFGSYWTSRSSFGYRLAVNDNHVNSFKTHQEALSAAQDDYENRIRSALEE